MAFSRTVQLRDGKSMPQLGFGVWQVPNEGAEAAVQEALNVGYRSIDTAAIYQNEEGVGKALNQFGISRDEFFITTKLWNEDQGYEKALTAFETSLKKLSLDYVDLYLVHWPSPHRKSYVESWKALIEIKKSGRAKSIGVSNFQPEHLEKIIAETGEIPVVNQVECHPQFQQKELRAFHAQHGILTESWSPLGQGKLLTDKGLQDIAAKHGRTPAQIVIRWHLQNNLIVIPKSVTPSRIKENFQVFDFELDAADLKMIESLDNINGRIGPNPGTAAF